MLGDRAWMTLTQGKLNFKDKITLLKKFILPAAFNFAKSQCNVTSPSHHLTRQEIKIPDTAIVKDALFELEQTHCQATILHSWRCYFWGVAIAQNKQWQFDDENFLIDIIRSNIKTLDNEYEQAIARSALIRACMKKRPRGIFTYTGNRYDDGRKDLVLSLEEQFLNAVELINNAIFDNGKSNISYRENALNIDFPDNCLIYMDPPYYSVCSDNEYVRRYHFVEGLSLDWEGIEIQEHTKTKKFKSYPTPFSSRKDVYVAFDKLFEKYKENILLISYSSNSLPNMDEMLVMLRKYKENVDVIPIDYKYSFGNQATKVGDNRNAVQEYLFVAY